MKVTARNREWFETADGTRCRGGASRDGKAQPFDMSDGDIRRYTRMGVRFDPADEGDSEALDALTGDPGEMWPSAFNAEQRAALEAAGFTTPSSLREATDEQLMAVQGIGGATVSKFRQATESEVVI